MPVITLMTDYGTRDQYVGVLKGVLLSMAPNVQIVDITHDIEPYNVVHGAFLLRQIWPWYPKGTIHLAIIDPGVGSERRIILGQYSGRFVVAPDNGLVTMLHHDISVEAMYAVEERRFFLSEVSPTFHGRDMMAPVAAHLANGVAASSFGQVADRLEMLPVAPRAERVGKALRGTVIYVDRFGTLVTNIREEQLAALGPHRSAFEVIVNETRLGPIRSAFFEVPPGDPVAFLGSCATLEVAVNQGQAVERFGKTAAVRVEVP